MFRLREADRSETEDRGIIEIVVEIANQRDLARGISLVLTPKIAPEDFTLLPSTTPFERANNCKLIYDIHSIYNTCISRHRQRRFFNGPNYTEFYDRWSSGTDWISIYF